LGKLGTRTDVTLHQEYMADIIANVKTAIFSVDPTPYFQKYGNNDLDNLICVWYIHQMAGPVGHYEKARGEGHMTSTPRRDPASEHLITPENAALVGQEFVHESIIDTTFECRVEAEAKVGTYPATMPSVAVGRRSWDITQSMSMIAIPSRTTSS
jgi:Proline racemase